MWSRTNEGSTPQVEAIDDTGSDGKDAAPHTAVRGVRCSVLQQFLGGGDATRCLTVRDECIESLLIRVPVLEVDQLVGRRRGCGGPLDQLE